MAKITFTADYNHRWPSRAVTHFKADWTGTVKREVADAAIAKGKATEDTKTAKPEGDGAKVRHRHSRRVDGRDPGADGNGSSRDGLEPGVDARDGNELPSVAGS